MTIDQDLAVAREVQVEVGSPVDVKRIERAVKEILLAIGEDPERLGLVDTPARVARAYTEMFAGLRADPATALGAAFEEGYQDFVVVSNISVSSVCEHHLLPFTGSATLGYVPGPTGAVAGLSKLARLVEVYARRPQVQERLTMQLADAMEAFLGAAGVVVVLDCSHSCMSSRGVRESEARTRTFVLRGLIRTDARYHAEALALLRGERLR